MAFVAGVAAQAKADDAEGHRRDALEAIARVDPCGEETRQPHVLGEMAAQSFGADGIRARLEAHVHLARTFASWIDDAPGWERLAPVPFSVVCFRHHPAGVDDEEMLERVNAAILERVNQSGEAFLSHTKLDGRYTLRLAIGNIKTEERHVRRAWELLSSAARTA